MSVTSHCRSVGLSVIFFLSVNFCLSYIDILSVIKARVAVEVTYYSNFRSKSCLHVLFS